MPPAKKRRCPATTADEEPETKKALAAASTPDTSGSETGYNNLQQQNVPVNSEESRFRLTCPSPGNFYTIHDPATKRFIVVWEGTLRVLSVSELRNNRCKVSLHWWCKTFKGYLVFKNMVIFRCIGMGSPGKNRLPLTGSTEVSLELPEDETANDLRFVIPAQEAREGTYTLQFNCKDELWPVGISDSNRKELVIRSHDFPGTKWEFIQSPNTLSVQP